MSIESEIRRRETARQIAEAMDAAGISKAELARLLGKSPSAVTAWLSGKHNFTIDLLAEISAVLGTQITGVTSDLVCGYTPKAKEAGLKDPAAGERFCGEHRIDTICLRDSEYDALSNKAHAIGVSLRSYVELILGREAREIEKSEEKRTKDFLANCLGAWSGEEFDGIEDAIFEGRTIRKVEEL